MPKTNTPAAAKASSGPDEAMAVAVVVTMALLAIIAMRRGFGPVITPR